MSGQEKVGKTHDTAEIPNQIGRILFDAVKNHDKPTRAEANQIRSSVRNRLDDIYANAPFEEEVDEPSTVDTPVEWPAPLTTFRLFVPGQRKPLVYKVRRQDDTQLSLYTPDPESWGQQRHMPTNRNQDFILLVGESEQESYFLPLK